MLYNMQDDRLIWTDEDTKNVKEYKEKIKSGKIKAIKYTGNLQEIIDSQF